MNTVNASTGFSGFQLKMGRSPRLVPPFSVEGFPDAPLDQKQAMLVLQQLQLDLLTAKDNLIAAKTAQAFTANGAVNQWPVFEVGEQVMLSTQNRRREYKGVNGDRVAKLMPRFDGPYKIGFFLPSMCPNFENMCRLTLSCSPVVFLSGRKQWWLMASRNGLWKP